MIKSFAELLEVSVEGMTEERGGIKYLPWATCLKLLYQNGAEHVTFNAEVNQKSGTPLFYEDVVFEGKRDNNRNYWVMVVVTIDDKTYRMSYPVINGTYAVGDKEISQMAVNKAIQRAFVKCVAINTGLGFGLWLKGEDEESKAPTDDINSHNVMKVGDRINEKITVLNKRGMSLHEIADKIHCSEAQLNNISVSCEILRSIEHNIDVVLAER